MIFSCTKVFDGEPCGEWVRISCALRAFQHVQTLRENVQCWFQVGTEKRFDFFVHRPTCINSFCASRLCHHVRGVTMAVSTTSSSGWWLKLDLSHTAVYCKYQKLYGEFHDLNKTHQDELLDCFFLLNVQVPHRFFTMMKFRQMGSIIFVGWSLEYYVNKPIPRSY